MAEGPLMLLILGSIMAVSSFLAGMLPLSISLSQRQLRIVTALGSGLLVGTALVIIIPEGIAALYSGEEKASKRAEHDHEHEGEVNHAIIGISLVLGFVLMYLIDAVPPLLTQRPASTGHIPLTASNGLEDEPHTPYKLPAEHSSANATTIGLVIHSFADGIALGASSVTPSVGLVVFVAIMLHKAPAAFGLTTALLKDGLNKKTARAHLLFFSLAAPLGALVTWGVVNVLSGGMMNGSNGFYTGVALMFSGGTFLYVAMHSLQGGHSAGALEHAGPHQPQKLDVLYTSIGMLLPLLTQLGHRHAHGH